MGIWASSLDDRFYGTSCLWVGWAHGSPWIVMLRVWVFFLKANLWTMSIPNGTKHWSLWDKEGLCSQLSPRWLIGLFKEQCYIRCSPVDSATIRPVKFIFLRGKEPGLRAHVLPLSLLTTPLSFLCMDAQCCSCSGWFKMWFLKTLTWSIYAI